MLPAMLPEAEQEDEGIVPHHVNRPSLVEDYLPSHLGCTQESLSCSVIIGGYSQHSRQTSQASDCSYISNFAHFLQMQEASGSPMKLEWSEEKENLGGTSKQAHRSTSSVLINSAVEQSYSNILGTLSNSHQPTDRPRKALAMRRESDVCSQDVISDCLSIIESDFRTPVDSMLTEPVIVQTAVGRSNPTSPEARTSTIYTNLSSDSSRITNSMMSPTGKAEAQNAFTSPYGATTTDSNLLEIDLYESQNVEKPVETNEASSSILGALPARAYCPNCCVDVSTRVSFEFPSEPL